MFVLYELLHDCIFVLEWMIEDMWAIIGFQPQASPIMEGIVDLNQYIFIYLICVFIVVFYMYLYILYNYYIVTNLFFFVNRDLDLSRIVEFYEVRFYERFILKGHNYMSEKTRPDIVEVTLFRSLIECVYVYMGLLATVMYKNILVTRYIVHNPLIEIIWTIIPTFILVAIAVPSFSLLYAMDELNDPKLTVKVIGYQWFWTYEYAQDFDVVEFDYLKDALGYSNRFFRDSLIYDSVMLSDDDLQEGYHRLLDVDHQMILPAETHLRIIVTAADVLHSWAVPSLGIKVDAVPGRMSQVGLFIKHEGVFYGQCSELCGVNHGFMPIVIKAVSPNNFLAWYREVSVV